MSLSNQRNGCRGYELYVGVFDNQSWTYQSLCDYFHRLIEESNITECHFYQCTNSRLADHSFAILTFTSIESIDQCLAKRDQIKEEHQLIVRRNVRDISKDEKPISPYVIIHLNQFDRSFNRENVLAYFGAYGSIIQWKILDTNRTFLLHFKDYDSVDRIFLDKPHFFNEQSLSIRKCYNPHTVTLTYSMDNFLKERIRNLQAGIDRAKYSHEYELMKLEKLIQDKLNGEETRLSEIMKSYIRLERIQRDLKQDLNDIRQINQKLKIQLNETMQKNQRLVDDFENQLEQQRLINKSLQESNLNFPQSC